MMAPSRGTEWNQTSNAVRRVVGSQSVGDKVHAQEGNSPDRRLRPQNDDSVEKDVGTHGQLGGWLRSSHPLKSA